MFRKTFKQLKILLIIIFVLLFFPRSFLPQKSPGVTKNEFEFYNNLNQREQRLLEYKDSEEALKLKILQLGIINNSRNKNKASPVKLDILASRVANKMCKEGCDNNYIGHWNMAGEKPYQRYAFAGGYDHVSENAYGEWSSDNYDTAYTTISSMMQSGHMKFMSEKPPDDGHKRNIIDKAHNFVGLGYYLSGNHFRYYEEFIDRQFEFKNIPNEVKVDEPCSITVITKPGTFLYYMIIYRDKFPQPVPPSRLSNMGSYDDFTDEEYQSIFAWDLSRYRTGNSYKIPLSFSKEGLYYIHIYSDKEEITSPASLNTKGKTPYSGIVIKVNK